MKKRKYDDIIRRLQEEQNENSKEIDMQTLRKNALEHSQNPQKIMATLGLSTISYIGLIIALIAVHNISTINIPPILSTGIIVTTSIVSGEILNRILTKNSRKYIAENKYTEAMKYEQMIKSEMKLEFLNNKDKIFENVIGKLQESQQMQGAIACLSERLDIEIQDSIPKNSDTYAKRITELEHELKSKYETLYKISKKNTLYKKAGNIYDIMQIIAFSSAAGATSACYMTIPMIGNPSTQMLIPLLASVVIGVTACASILNKQNKHLKAALNKLESQLSSSNEEKTIEELIKEISQIEFLLQEQKSKLEEVEKNKKSKYEYKFEKEQQIKYCEPQPYEIEERKVSGEQKVYVLKYPKGR